MAAADAVTVAWVHENDNPYSFTSSLLEFIGYDAHNAQRFFRGGYIAMRCGTDGLPGARNQTVEQYLDDPRAEWFCWLDTDMGFAPDFLEQLIAVAHPVDRPVVGALCFAWRELETDGMGGYRCQPAPTIYDHVETPEGAGFMGRAFYTPGSLIRCDGTGSACILIHRTVFERVGAVFGPEWYSRVRNPTTGKLTSEDLSFCERLRQLGIPVYVHTGVKTTHAKNVWVSERDFWSAIEAPPAVDSVDIIVPVLGRPEHAEPFMRSLIASTGLATVWAVVQPDDKATAAAWREAGAEVLEAPEGVTTFAAKANHAYQHLGRFGVAAPWVMLVGSDVVFRAGWLDHALGVAGRTGADLVATNDLGNPHVMAGTHATHPLIRRSYVDEIGATLLDGPGVLCHEGYRHNWIDNEWTFAAQRRGRFAAALGAHVEHLHPVVGKGEWDDVYRLGRQSYDADRELFRARVAEATAVDGRVHAQDGAEVMR